MWYVSAWGSQPTSTRFDLISGNVIVHEHVAYNKQVQRTFLHTQGGDECSNGRDGQIPPKLFNLNSPPLEISISQKQAGTVLIVLKYAQIDKK